MSASADHPNPLLAYSPVELAAGIDALYLSARGEVPAELLDELDGLKQQARESEKAVPAVFGGYPLEVLGSAWGKYRFCLKHEMGRIGITASERLPSVRFQPSSRALHSSGPAMTVLFLRNLLDAVGIDAVVQVARLDLHSDWQGFWIEPDERSNFVTYSDKRALYEVGNELSGLNFGKRGGALYARIYDKTRESQAKGHDWWPEVWGPSFDADRPVLRIEFEFSRTGLRETGIHSPEDAFENMGALWAYATLTWLTLRIPTGDDTRSRWPLDPRWEAVQKSRLWGNELPAERMRAGNDAGELRLMLPQLVGYLAGSALPLNTNDLDATIDALRPHIEAYGQRTGIDFPMRIADKRAKR